MSDIFTKEKRSEIMSRIKGSNTKPEIAVRKILHAMGFRFRLHDKKLPGKPDIILPRHKNIIFVHGCFWHGHNCCNRSKIPDSNSQFWQNKIAANIKRDSQNIDALKALGWKTLVIWTCEKKELLEEKLKGFMNYGATEKAD